jgi:hypothetical protein
MQTSSLGVQSQGSVAVVLYVQRVCPERDRRTLDAEVAHMLIVTAAAPANGACRRHVVVCGQLEEDVCYS